MPIVATFQTDKKLNNSDLTRQTMPDVSREFEYKIPTESAVVTIGLAAICAPSHMLFSLLRPVPSRYESKLWDIKNLLSQRTHSDSAEADLTQQQWAGVMYGFLNLKSTGVTSSSLDRAIDAVSNDILPMATTKSPYTKDENDVVALSSGDDRYRHFIGSATDRELIRMRPLQYAWHRSTGRHTDLLYVYGGTSIFSLALFALSSSILFINNASYVPSNGILANANMSKSASKAAAAARSGCWWTQCRHTQPLFSTASRLPPKQTAARNLFMLVNFLNFGSMFGGYKAPKRRHLQE